MRLAHEVGVTVGWLLDEPGYRIGVRGRTELLQAAKIILDLTGHDGE